VSLGGFKRRYAPIAVALLVVFAVSEISTQQVYVRGSREPTDLHDASSAKLIPAFRTLASRSPEPIVAAGTSPFLLEVESIADFGRPLYFLSRDVFTGFVAPDEAKVENEHPNSATARLLRADGPRTATLREPGSGRAADTFTVNPPAERALASGSCNLVIPTRAEEPFNGRPLPGTTRDQIELPCKSPRDLLAYVNSDRGQNFYLLGTHGNISFYPFETDFFFPPNDFVGFGRYALFQALGPTTGMRMVLSYSFTLRHDGSNAIPPSSVLGRTRYAFPVLGRGSARVISPPLTPQMVDGDPYLFLDIGEPTRVASEHRSGLQGLFSSTVALDPRALTGYVRDVSLISASQYRRLRPPLMVASFPAGLANPDLQYSGLYEDGWVARDSYLVLGSGPVAEFELNGTVPPGGGGKLEVLLNGRRLTTVRAPAGRLAVHAAVPASLVSRKIELRFTRMTKLRAPDLRPVSALLLSVGFADRAHA
jgi:hypothetical protein